MSKEGVDAGRRRFLTLTTAVVGGAGAVAAVWPFLASLQPSERAKALGAPVTVDISKIEPGQKLTVAWRGKPVWFINRTPEMLADIAKIPPDELRDPNCLELQQPEYAKNIDRSIKPEMLVMIGVCTHLGCSPTFRPDHPAPEIRADWLGGFFCPCHGSLYDLSGRVYKDVPAPLNMVIPPYHYASASVVIVGEDQKGAA